jgi:hypothetical protein
MAAVDALLDAEKILNVTRHSILIEKTERYIIEKADNKKQKKLIAKYVDLLKQDQDKANERSKGNISVFTTNVYDAMAIGYYRLGDKKNSTECAKKYEDMYRVQKEELKKYFSDNNTEVEKTYKAKIAALHAKIGMK